jgi:uncharacterized protein (DUF2147 family)
MWKVYKLPAMAVMELLLFSGTLWAQTDPGSDAIVGVWLNPDNGVKVGTYKDHDRYYGKINEFANGKSPDGQVNVGTLLLKDLAYSDKHWTGQIYAPKRGTDYPVTITLPDSGTMELKVKAGMFSRTLTWKKVSK